MLRVPAYQEYMVKTRVAEALVVLKPMQLQVVENATVGAALHSNIRPLVAPRWIESATVKPGNGWITVRFKPSLTGDGVRYEIYLIPKSGYQGSPSTVLEGDATSSVIPASNQFSWSCRAAGSDGAKPAQALPARYAPPICNQTIY